MVQPTHSVLFVCYANICRSPMGEAIFDHLAKQAGVRDKWLIDSVSISDHEDGNSIYSTAQEVLRKHSINYEHTARKIELDDFYKYNLILGFDPYIINELEYMKPATSHAEIRLVNYFNPNPKKKNKSIADPWIPDSLAAYEMVYQDCYDSSKMILEIYQ